MPGRTRRNLPFDSRNIIDLSSRLSEIDRLTDTGVLALAKLFGKAALVILAGYGLIHWLSK